VLETARSFSLDFVIAATESGVMLAAQLRDLLGLPGTSVAIAELAHNKFTMKSKAIQYDIPLTPFHLVQDDDTAERLVEKLGLPLVLKPVDESGATDVRVASSLQNVKQFVAPGLLAEAFVKGPEVSVETFVVDGKPVFHNITDYLHQWRKSLIPASLGGALTQTIIALNDKVIESFGIQRGLTHAEFYLTEDGPVFGEIAVRPPGGYYMELIERAYGFDTWEAYIAVECGECPVVPTVANSFAAVYIIHPGEGRVESVVGAKQIRNLKGVFEFDLELVEGERVADHVNTSNEVGHVLLTAKTRDALLEKLEYIESVLKITLVGEKIQVSPL